MHTKFIWNVGAWCSALGALLLVTKLPLTLLPQHGCTAWQPAAIIAAGNCSA
jgi:hypothetical protein